MNDMTDEQVENWRKVLYRMFGPVGLLCPREQVIAFRDQMQADIHNKYTEAMEKVMEELKPCTCDPAKHGKTVHVDGRVTCNKCQKERKP